MTQPPDLLALEINALLADSSPAVEACLSLARQLHGAQRFAEGERLTVHAVAIHPIAKDLWNIRGVFLRTLRRPSEAISAFAKAIRIDPTYSGAMINRGNVLLDIDQCEAALESFQSAVQVDPQGALPRTMVGRAYLRLGRTREAVEQFTQATTLQPGYVEAWMMLVSALNDAGQRDAADIAISESLCANPDSQKLLEAKALLLRISGRRQEAREFLTTLLHRMPTAPWIHFHLGDLLAVTDPVRAIGHLRKAVDLAPTQQDHMFGLLRALGVSLVGDEGAQLDEAYGLASLLTGRPGLSPAHTSLLRDIFARLCAFDSLERLGTFEDLGRAWANAGQNASLMYHLAQANTPERALELIDQHRIWGAAVEARAASAPIARVPKPRTGKVRLGFMSSDLRDHPVGRFALPLFDHLDRNRFDVFVYSFYRGPADPVQSYIARQVNAFRNWPEITPRDAAQGIADDQLDMLIELGGPTDMNMPEVMAYRPAARQASWLGYPHSTGLSTIDDYICDPHNAPVMPGLLIEAPLLMPRSWIAVSDLLLKKVPPVSAELPEQRHGYLTFGTANNPYKYTRDALAAWAQVVAAVPGSHFMFVRPEAGSKVFRQNIQAVFAAEGVTADRIDWRVTRGGHLAAYNDIDISLDTFPLTGGTTTVEALLMGVPVISVRGQAFFQRLSASILANLGLEDLCADTVADFADIAAKLALDPDRRLSLRKTLRSQLEKSPLGDAKAFANDFYDMIYGLARPTVAAQSDG